MSENHQLQDFSLSVLALAAVTGILWYTKDILMPFLLAILGYIVLSEIKSFLERRLNIKGWMALSLTLILMISGALLVGGVMISSIHDFIQSAGTYREKLISASMELINLAEWAGVKIDRQSTMNELRNLPLWAWFKGLTGGIVNLLGTGSLIVLIVLFLLFGDNKNNLGNVGKEIQTKISQYLVNKTMVSLLTGFLVGVLLLSFSVDLAFMFAVLTILLNFIPTIGSLIAIFVPLPVVFLQFGLGPRFFVILALSAVIQFLVGNVLEPKLMGEAMDLHPVTIILFLLFWGLVWGIPGMFLAVPITAVLKIILARIPKTRPVSELFAGRIMVRD